MNKLSSYSVTFVLISFCGLVTCCENPKDTTLNAYPGWPLTLSCDENLVIISDCDSNVDYYDYSSTVASTAYEYKCTIISTSTSRVLLNYSFNATEPTDFVGSSEVATTYMPSEGETIVIELKSSSDNVVTQNVTFAFLDPPTSPCTDSLQEELECAETESIRMLSCQPIYKSNQINYAYMSDDTSFNWLKNCESITSPDINMKSNDYELRVEVTNQTPGIYSCTATSNNQTVTIQSYNITVKSKSVDSLTMRCHDSILSDVGDDVTVSCNVDVGVGDVDGDYTIIFQKVNQTGSVIEEFDNSSCVLKLEQLELHSPNNRTHCKLDVDANPPKCFVHPFASKEVLRSTLELTFTLREITEVEFGYYSVSIHNPKDKIREITLIIEKSKPNNGALWGSIVAVCVALLICMLAVRFQIEIQWFYKHHFGAYEKVGDKLASIQYNFNNQTLGADEQNQVREVYKEMVNFIHKNLHGELYDATKENAAVENVSEQLLKNFRMARDVIVILSRGYINAEWNRRELYDAVTHFIENKGVLIIIKLPGCSEAIQEQSAKSQENILNTILQMSIVIDWNGKLTNKGRMMLELALPKVRPKPRNDTMYNNIHANDNVL